MTAVAERVEELADFRAWARELRDDRIAQRSLPPMVRLWDGNYSYRGRCCSELDAAFPWELNDTGIGDLTLPIDFDDERATFLAHWILDEEARGTRDVNITVDKDGGRWSGLMESATLNRDPKGDTVTVTFKHDYEHLKNVHCAPNPFLPMAVVQFPKVFMLAGPAIHTLKTALFLNLLRLQVTGFSLPADPLNPAAWTGMTFTNWPIVVKPGSILEDSSPWTIVTSRMKSWHDMAAPVLDDAELYVECRRWLTGDPPPWDGAPTLRNGTLVVDIIDKSGFREGTSLAGSLITGLARTVADTIGDDVEDSYDLITGEPTPPEGYRIPNQLRTLAAHPHVVYRDGEVTGIQQSSFTRKAAGPCRISTGGKSAPFVNEMIKAAVNYGGDVLGDNILIPGLGFSIGSLGMAIDAFIHGMYEDVLLSYNSTYLAQRAAESGWARLQETIVPGINQAYVLSAVMALRARRRETDPETAFDLSIVDAGPFLIGDQGQGHWFHGDRIGGTNKYLGTRVFVRRCRHLEIAWGRDTPLSWKAQMGDLRSKKDPLSRGLGMLAETMSWLQEGVGIL
ncbi:hypothetical protein [Gordonia sp. UBA7599]|uniref:Gp37-like protein n=1 Tax=unclassified Gordonia (in: high G+C Gram-positive bacteria) TaxID=2657482 RepID=UPI0025C03C6F|nr:hypothetical protein [Gordonia sp. UBA7599]HNP58433.1 hypothetical protein [Gordonia sp. (in: high G+C Gram-positive bacteria)]